MRIGVIAYELEGARSGVGRYLEGLLKGLSELGQTDHSWLLLMKGHPFEDPLFELPGVKTYFDGRPESKPIPWEQIRLALLLRRLPVDAIFSPGYSLPMSLAGTPQAVTLHDLSFEHMREEFRMREGLRRRILARRAAKVARRVLVDTEAMAEDLHRTYELDRSKIGVVPLAVDRHFFQPEPFPLAELGIRQPYLLCLGSILPRRRLDLVIEAFSAAAPESMQLVIAGRNRLPEPQRLQRWLAASPARGRIVRLDYVPEKALSALYAQAEASLYLSSYEGYGLPPLESLAAGTAALTCNGMALDDLIPDYPYRTELRKDAVETALRGLLADPDRDRVVAAAREKLREVTWKRCAEIFLEELEIAFESAT